MNISNFDYFLPHEFIAQKPANPRDSSKLLVLNRFTGTTTHSVFNKITDLLTDRDVLVFNKSKVFPARIFAQKRTKGKVELLILRFLNDSVCEVISKPGLHLNEKIFFEGFTAEVIKRDGYVTHLLFSIPQEELKRQINLIGHTPIPPYIDTPLSEKDLREKYQTVYASSVGSAAAPTAGLHFTKELIKKLKKIGVQTEFVTLHVGLGTFAPVKENELEKHKIHEEYFEINPETVKNLNTAKKAGKRIIAVGTTTTRVLETLTDKNSRLQYKDGLHYTDQFIYPAYKYKFVDALITNFHLPKSTLLALVSAFVSSPNSKSDFTDFESGLLGNAYKEAIRLKYRFFSFGDAMFIS